MKPKTVGRAEGGTTPQHPIRAEILGIPTGTIVLTQDGEMPVEYLCAADRIITRDAGMVRLAAISRGVCRQRAILFAAGSPGHSGQDLTLPAAQPVLIRDWRAPALTGRRQAILRADGLVDHEFIRDLGQQEMILHQLHFDQPHIIYAAGMELGCGDMPVHQVRAAA